MPQSRNLPARPLAAMLVAVLAMPAAAELPPGALGERDPALLPSEILPLSDRALLLDATRTSAGVFAVGERGILLRSAEAGGWEQLPLPTRLTMTAIATRDGDLWVGGHGGQILRSSDNGETWIRQRIDLSPTDYSVPTAGAPVLDLHFTASQTGFAAGAFSLLLRTRDGGATWEPLSLPKPQADEPVEDAGATDPADWVFSDDELELDLAVDPHLNAIASTPDGTLFIAGERGAMFRSRDGGDSWERLAFPYDGSMFGLLTWNDGHVLAFGLRGNVFETLDGGDSWSQLDTGVEITLQGGVALPDGGVVLVGNEGLLLRRDDALSPLRRDTFENDSGETPTLTGVLPADAGFLLIGEKGVARHDF